MQIATQTYSGNNFLTPLFNSQLIRASTLFTQRADMVWITNDDKVFSNLKWPWNRFI